MENSKREKMGWKNFLRECPSKEWMPIGVYFRLTKMI